MRSRRSLGVAAAVAAAGAASAGALWLLQRRTSHTPVSPQDLVDEGLTMPRGTAGRFVEVDDGARIFVDEAGSGPAIVLLHGFMLDGTIWAQQFRDLAGTHRLIAIDQRGHGRSETGFGFGSTPAAFETGAPGATASGPGGERLRDVAYMAERGVGAPGVRRLAEDLHVVLEELEVEEALLVGHSMGGMVALQLAQDRPSVFSRRVTGVVLVSTMAGPFSSLPGFTGVARLAAPASARAALFTERVAGHVVPGRDMRYWVSRMGFGADATPAQVRFVEALHTATPVRTISGLLPSLTLFDLSATLERIEVPALVVVGSHDRLTPPRQARRMADALAHAQLVELARCGHMPMIERPHEFAHMLAEFSAKTSAA